MKGRLEKYDEQAVTVYERYVMKLQTEKDKKTGALKNPWAINMSLDTWVAHFEKVAATGFFIDGDNISIGSTGISLNYQAYKNLVIKKYPEATFDMQLVRLSDEFSFRKENGKVYYTHNFSNPFGDEDYKGAYCIIKLRTGEFIELMSKKDLEYTRKTAETDYIWAAWTSEMYLKTIIKKACKRHFKDAVEILDTMDNDNYDLSIEEELDDNIQLSIESCNSSEELTALWQKYKNEKVGKKLMKAIIQSCAARKKEILGAVL